MATSSADQKRGESVSPLLVVAALARELAALGREPRAGVELIETGEGTVNAERAIRSRLEQREARAVVGIGFAGALSDSLKVGDCVIACKVRGTDRDSESFAASSDLISAAEMVGIDGLRFGTAITVDEIVVKAIEKRRLANLLERDEIGCVDMESSAIARACSERGVPFLIARAITDLIDEDLPIDFNRCRAADGRVSAQKVIQAALRRPRSFKGLLELKRRSEMCAEKLASFVQPLLRLIQ